jgi:2-polyprenyl-3-methyl-5-hydroxy-6-metoxy-1,4-benzoquinol methylase
VSSHGMGAVEEVGVVAALRLLHETFAHASGADRMHTLGRFLTCPFLRVVERVPRGARVLDLGSGHGILAHLLTARSATVTAVEPDLRKLWTGRPRPGVAFVGAYSDALATLPRFDVVTICDVLCRMPSDAWPALLESAFAGLRPGGVLLLKEIDPENRVKGVWNRAQEKVADFLGMTLGDAFTYETKAQMRERLRGLGFEESETVPVGTWYPHAHLLYVAKKPGAASDRVSAQATK